MTARSFFAGLLFAVAALLVVSALECYMCDYQQGNTQGSPLCWDYPDQLPTTNCILSCTFTYTLNGRTKKSVKRGCGALNQTEGCVTNEGNTFCSMACAFDLCNNKSANIPRVASAVDSPVGVAQCLSMMSWVLLLTTVLAMFFRPLL